MGNHELLLGTLRKKEFSKEIQGVVAAVLDSRARVPNPVGIETVLRMVGRCGKVFELCNMGMNPQVWLAVDSDGKEHIFDKPVTRFDPSKKNEFKGAISLRELNSPHPIWVEKDAKERSMTVRIELPKGTIEKITGRKITWGDPAIQLS